MGTYRTVYNTVTPIDEQVQLDPTKTSMSKTDTEGIIEYANEAFMNVCGFSKSELMGRPHSIVRHPDMPKVVFKLMWERLHKGEGIYAVVKNLTKQGRYYWVIAKINSKFDEEGKPIAHYARRKAAPVSVVEKVKGLYQTLRAIEEDQTPEVAEKYFYGLLEDMDVTYDEFIAAIIGKEQVSIDSFFANLTARLQTAKEKEQELKDEEELTREQKLQNNNIITVNKKQSIPIDREIKLDFSRVIMSKTDSKGIIEYANDYFLEICGYEEFELIGQPHNIIRHPDMPKVIFKLLWERLHEGKNIHALVKNLAKGGRYYWVLTNFETKYDEQGNIISHYARRKAAPGKAIYKIEKLYRTLVAIEKTQGLAISEKYFYGLLEERKMSYDEFILEVLDMNEKELYSYFLDEKELRKDQKKSNLFSKLCGK